MRKNEKLIKTNKFIVKIFLKFFTTYIRHRLPYILTIW